MARRRTRSSAASTEVAPTKIAITETVEPAATWMPAGSLTIERAADAWEEARAAVRGEARDTAHVDLRQVERIDTAGCQVLVRLAAEARARGLAWRLSGCAPGVAATIRLLGCALLLWPASDGNAEEKGSAA